VETMMSQSISYVLNDGVALITMDDGKANAVSPDFIVNMNKALDQAEADNTIVVLAGREGKFCAGFDLTVMQAGGAAADKLLADGARLAYRMLAHPAPIVMACTGHCLAMGALFALSVDYRIGAEGRFKIGLNEVAIKMTMPHFGVELAKARLAPAHQIPAVACSVLYGPQDAVTAGFLDKVVAEDQVIADAMATAEQLKQIDLKAHHETKLRMRAELLQDVEGLIAKG